MPSSVPACCVAERGELGVDGLPEAPLGVGSDDDRRQRLARDRVSAHAAVDAREPQRCGRFAAASTRPSALIALARPRGDVAARVPAPRAVERDREPDVHPSGSARARARRASERVSAAGAADRQRLVARAVEVEENAAVHERGIERLRAVEPLLLGDGEEELERAVLDPGVLGDGHRRGHADPVVGTERRSRRRAPSRRRGRGGCGPPAGRTGSSGSRSHTMSRCDWRTTIGARSRPGVAGTTDDDVALGVRPGPRSRDRLPRRGRASRCGAFDLRRSRDPRELRRSAAQSPAVRGRRARLLCSSLDRSSRRRRGCLRRQRRGLRRRRLATNDDGYRREHDRRADGDLRRDVLVEDESAQGDRDHRVHVRVRGGRRSAARGRGARRTRCSRRSRRTPRGRASPRIERVENSLGSGPDARPSGRQYEPADATSGSAVAVAESAGSGRRGERNEPIDHANAEQDDEDDALPLRVVRSAGREARRLRTPSRLPRARAAEDGRRPRIRKTATQSGTDAMISEASPIGIVSSAKKSKAVRAAEEHADERDCGELVSSVRRMEPKPSPPRDQRRRGARRRRRTSLATANSGGIVSTASAIPRYVEPQIV